MATAAIFKVTGTTLARSPNVDRKNGKSKRLPMTTG